MCDVECICDGIRRFCDRVCCDAFSKFFFVFLIYIFGRAILLLFQKIVGGVLDRVYCICLCCIVVITILVWWLRW